MFANFRADLFRARRQNVGPGWFDSHVQVFLQPGMIAVMMYRLGRWLSRLPVPVLRHLLLAIFMGTRYVVEAFTHVHLSLNADIGPGLVVHLPWGIFVPPTRIGRNCTLNHGVVLNEGVLQVGDDVYFAPGAKVVGPVRIGNNVMIAPNSLVLTNVPDNVTVMGVPARVRWPRSRTWNPDMWTPREDKRKAATTKAAS